MEVMVRGSLTSRDKTAYSDLTIRCMKLKYLRNVFLKFHGLYNSFVLQWQEILILVRRPYGSVLGQGDWMLGIFWLYFSAWPTGCCGSIKKTHGNPIHML